MRSLVLVFFAALHTAMNVSAAERQWTRSEILAIADAEAKRLGYDVEQMSISFDPHNSLWILYQVTPMEEKLSGHQYWAVAYSNLPGCAQTLVAKARQMGDSGPVDTTELTFIFIDRHSGEFLGYFKPPPGATAAIP